MKDDVDAKTDVLEGKLESMRTDQVTKKQLEKERREADTKVDDIVKARLDETMQEENEKKQRKNNVTVFGFEESSAAEAVHFLQTATCFLLLKITPSLPFTVMRKISREAQIVIKVLRV